MEHTESPKIYDPILILIGNRGAIHRLAGSPHTIIIGALLVITAGLARNYDHHALFIEWQWLYGPYIASFLSSLIIFYFGCARHCIKKKHNPKGQRPYLTFLSVYWMTSPCAWLYAIPVESFTDIVTATKWNIAFLATVSIWRVLLMSRYLSVMSGEHFLRSFMSIAWPAATIMCIASFFKGIALVGIMGGVELSDHQIILKQAANFTTSSCFFIAIITLFFALVISQSSNKIYHPTRTLPWKPWDSLTIPKLLNSVTFIFVSITLAIVALLPIQKQTVNNYKLTSLIKQGKNQEAIEFASKRNRNDFLKHHTFPPGKTQYYYHFKKLFLLLSKTTKDTPQWLLKEWLTIVEPDKSYGTTAEQLTTTLNKYFPEDTPHQQKIREHLFEKYTIIEAQDEENTTEDQQSDTSPSTNLPH